MGENLTWALFLFQPGDTASMAWSMQDGQAGRHASVKAATETIRYIATPSASTYEEFDWQSGAIQYTGDGWASLYVVADDIRLESAGNTSLRTALTGDAPGAYVADVGSPQGTWRWDGELNAPGTVAWSVKAQQDQPHFRLAAEGLRRAEWHNATSTCRFSGPCPIGGNTTEAGALPGSRTELLEYGEIRGGRAALEGEGVALWAAGGHAPSVKVSGQLRLPLADLSPPCPKTCLDPEGKTVLVQGNLSLATIHPHRDHSQRLEATVTGDIVEGRLDETPFRMRAAAIGVAVSVSLLAGVALALRHLLCGLWRHDTPVLEQPRRRDLHRLIAQEPGLNFHELRRRLGLASGAATHHLRVLEQEGIVMAQRHGNRRRYFENHGLYKDSWLFLSTMRDDSLKALYDWIRDQGSVLRRDVLKQTSSWGWKRGISQYRLSRLAAANLLRIERVGRQTLYRTAG